MKNLRFAAALAGLALVAAGTLAPPAHAVAEPATPWYLAIGDSVSKGLQPGTGIDPDGAFTGQVLGHLQASNDKFKQRNLACHVTETSGDMINGGDCVYEEGSQLAQALVFLRAHSDTTGVITLTIGGNDLSECVRAGGSMPVITACATTALGGVATNLSRILHDLHAAAPNATIIVGNYYNPFVVHPTLGGPSVALVTALNNVIAGVAGAYGDPVADVAGAFHSAPAYPLPEAQAYVCTYTWMCRIGNIHPNDGGYDLMADAFIARL